MKALLILLGILKKANYLDKYRIVQIKEKYGSLRWYDAGVPIEISEELDMLIIKLHYSYDLSIHTFQCFYFILQFVCF